MEQLGPSELRTRREALGLTQAALATALGVTANAVARWERGERTIRQPTLVNRALQDLERGSVEQPDGVLLSAGLPLQSERLIGRELEVQTIRRLLLSDEVRFLTLVGPGGTGKTRLAVEAAARVGAEFRDGVVFVDLSPNVVSSTVLPSIGRALRVRDVTGRRLVETLRDSLHGQSLLIVLDNCEQVLSGVRAAGDVLVVLPSVTVLATSREPVQFEAEHVFAVPPLAHPDPQRVPPLEQLAEMPAVTLFVERAQAVQPSFTLTNENAAGVAEICARLDGLPLAIELAAARSQVLPVRAMAVRLRQRLDVLRSDKHDRPNRHQTIEATLAWSYDLLTPAEQTLFRHLSVFAGGATLEAAEAVCAPNDILEGVASLISKNLLQVAEQPDGQPRYRMLQTVQIYAGELLRIRENDEETWVRGRHAAYFLDLAERAECNLRGSEQELWLNAVERDHDNLRAALSWTLEWGPAEAILRLAGALAAYWSVRGPFTEGREWLERALAADQRAPAALRAKVASGMGTMCWCLSEFQLAVVWHQTALELFDEAGDSVGQAFSLYNLGVQTFHQGEYGQARGFFERSEEQYRAIGDRWGLASSLLAEGVLALERSEDAHAARLCEQSLSHFRAVGDLRSAGLALNNLGELARRQGDDRRAQAMYERALALARTLNDVSNAAMLLHNLGHIALRRKRLDDAAAWFAEGLALARALREKRVLALCLAGCAALAVASGRPARAGRLLGTVESLLEQLAAPFESVDREVLDRTAAAVRAGLGGAAAESERAIGRTLSLDEAVGVAAEATADRRSGTDVPNDRPGLSPREREVVALVARGQTNRQIAEALVISERTASIHVQHIFDKLGFNTRSQVAAWAVRQELTRN